MSQNLIPTAVALGLVVPVPLDTESVDAASLIQFVQPTINAIAYNTNQIAALNASLSAVIGIATQGFSSPMGGSAIAAGAVIPFTGIIFNSGYTVDGANHLLFPANGFYAVSAYFELFPSGNAAEFVTLKLNGSDYATGSTTSITSAGLTTHLVQTAVHITAFATDNIRFVATWFGGVGTQTAQPSSSNVTVRRLS